jgi:hypothetical protein
MFRAMVDSHPDLCIPGESHFLTSLLRPWRRRRLTDDGRVVPERLIAALGQSRQFRNWGLDEDRLRSVLSADPTPDLAEAVRRVYAMHATAAGKPRYGDKTPSYVDSILPIGRLLPEARFVHLVRDGRDVTLSQLAIEQWGPTTVDEAAAEWVRQLRHGRRSGARLGPHRYLEVRYEDLVSSTEDVLRGVAEFLELPWAEEMLRYDQRADVVLRDVALPGNQQSIRLAPTGGLRSWETEMQAGDVHRFEAIASEELTRHGYRLSHEPSVVERARGALMRGRQAAASGITMGRSVARRARSR